MSKSLQNARIERECTHLCRSKTHASQCIAAATKRGVTDQQLASYLVHLCSNFAKKQDEVGRSVLHVAASCGKHELCQWLLTCASANPNLRDFESGYSSLHRALYYGHVNTAVRLIQFGVSLDICDNEDMTVLDMLSKERSPLDTLSLSMLCQPYVWGANNNYSLGTGSNNTRKLPDLLEFTKQSISIIQVELEELHSVYVSACGKVWTCGMGQGGRLGTGSGKSALTPQPIKIQEKCIAAAVGINHSLLLLDNHIVLSFGSNLEHQLGVNPYVDSCLSPRQVCNKNFSSSNPITGICASKYHSVFYNDTYVWTCGLNGGQLGRPSNPASPYITLPMKAALSTNGRKITNVATSIGAIVVTVANGDIYILYKFQCKKMASKQLDVVKVGAIGGTLESPSIFEQSSELRVVILNSRGSILLWREGAQHPARCIFGTKQCINVGDFCLTQQHLLLVTKDGSAFEGSFTNNPQQYVPSLSEKSGSKTSNQFHKFVDKSECYSVKLKRLANVFRGVSVRADPKGNNFVIIQTHPKTALTDIPVISESEVPLQMAALFNEASEDDPIHDGVFNVSGRIFPVHCYILSINGKLMADQVAKEKTVILKETNPYIFEEILLFLYTGTCQLIQPGIFNSKKIGKKEDPLKLALEICNKYKIQVLSKKLQKLRYEPGKIYLKEGYDSISGEELQFDHLSGSEYYDVTIKAEDGSIVKAHKCMLVARLHYFQSMFLGGWSETGKNSVLPLPFSSNVLKDLIDFIYTDKLPDYLSPDDVDHVIRLLIAGDQFLVKRLKECCELLLINALTLRNAPTILHLACMYNTPQLKASSIQFISLNLASFLQSRLLEVLDDDILKALTDYYQDYTKKKYRVLTPLPGVPTDEEVEQCPPIPWPEVFSINEKADIPPELKSPPSATKHKKKTPKKSSTTFGDSLEVTEVEVCTSQPEVQTAPKTLIPEKQILTERSKTVEYENIDLWNSSSFPQLDSHSDKQSKPSNLRLSEMSRRVFPPKMSQKERKRLGSECENTVIAVSPPKPVKTWATLPPPPSQNPTSDYSKRDSFSEDTNFINIVAHDKEKRANWAKMKSKPFHLTQLEDKAIDELLLFYNASNEFDERITVERVITHNIDKPQWIKTNLKV